MNHFTLINGELHCEGVSLRAIAEAAGTPTYVYSTATLERHYTVLAEALGAYPELGRPLIAYAVKANGNLSVLATLARLGAGADTVSEGEIRRALAAGFPAERIVFSGVGKTNAELDYALTAGVGQINVESAAELERLEYIAAARKIRPAVALRVNPDVGAGGHAKITTGAAANKFGVSVEQALELYARAAATGAVNPVGLACHIGSQITDLEPLRRAFLVLKDMTQALRARGLSVTKLDLGGGLGVPYFNQPEPPAPDVYAAMVAETLSNLGVELAFEPGRMIAANAGVLLTRVIRVNARPDGRRFLVLDAAMNDLLRPAMYEAYHELLAVAPRAGTPQPYDIVGPVCETGDTFARDRKLTPFEAGDLAVFLTAGAYGAAMASEYNSRPLVAEVLVRGEDFALVRPRPTYDEMLGRERIAQWLAR